MKEMENRTAKDGEQVGGAAQNCRPTALPPNSGPGSLRITGLPPLSELPGAPFAAYNSDGFVHTGRASDLRRPVFPRAKDAPPPKPFVLRDGCAVALLPAYTFTTPRVTSAEVKAVATAHPEFGIEEAVATAEAAKNRGSGDFLQQVERARAYLRGPSFLRLKPERKGHAAGWLKHQAEEHKAGTYRGYVGEMALIVAAILDDLRTEPFPGSREHGTVFR